MSVRYAPSQIPMEEGNVIGGNLSELSELLLTTDGTKLGEELVTGLVIIYKCVDCASLPRVSGHINHLTYYQNFELLLTTTDKNERENESGTLWMEDGRTRTPFHKVIRS